MRNLRIDRIEKSFQLEYEQKPLNIILGSLSFEDDTMIICVNDGFSGTIAEGNQYMEDHPEHAYYIFGDYYNEYLT